MAEDRARANRLKIFDRARWLKTSRFTVSGLVVIVIGGILVAFGMLYSNGNSSSVEGLLLGFGSLIVLIGIIRLVIGFINPLVPEQLDEMERPSEEDPIFPTEE
jgi:hypothetical protein